jgi:hypothetical protein
LFFNSRTDGHGGCRRDRQRPCPPAFSVEQLTAAAAESNFMALNASAKESD